MPRLSERAACAAWAAAALATLLPAAAGAYGVQGHLIAGRVAAGFLCPAAAAQVGRLGAGDSLDELGLWADRIRSDARFEHTAPWHYMNIADGGSMARYASPPEGDVLTAIERFHRVLADSNGGGAANNGSANSDLSGDVDGGDEAVDDSDEPGDTPARAEALRFLTHFIVDLHQPLHVGRAADRGGNSIDVIVDGNRINLHRLWDTEAITSSGLGTFDYARAIADDVAAALPDVTFDPRGWAGESLAYRQRVYAFGSDGVLSAAYLDDVRAITRERLVLAAARLAGTLNALFCE